MCILVYFPLRGLKIRFVIMTILPQPSKDLHISGKNYVKKRKKERFILRAILAILGSTVVSTAAA